MSDAGSFAFTSYTLLAYRHQLPYYPNVKAVFIELPPFERHRAEYLDDDAFREFQSLLMLNPEAGDLIPWHRRIAQAAICR